jgi:hypothetical protein
MNHKISEFCDKVDSLKKMADDLRVLKYKTPKSSDRDLRVQNLIDTIQADCLLLAHDKGDYVKSETGEYGDYTGIVHDSVFINEEE